ncbi:MAG: dTDP-glucose pyrophosphorylase [Neolewinella sp.]|jgi:dTDP-glucose pyrophosphorylase
MHSDILRHLISHLSPVREALRQLDVLAADAVLFLVDEEHRLIASLTDGDIRRGLINGFDLDAPLIQFTQQSPKAFVLGKYDLAQMRAWRSLNYRIVPVVDQDNKIVDIVNFRKQRSYLPLDAIIMAGGVGSRLRPLTHTVPKPLLPLGEKPIIEHNVDRLRSFGAKHLTISINYLGEQIVDYFGDGGEKGMEIRYVTEDEPRGTIGAVSEVEKVFNDVVLVMNSDLLTTIDLEGMFADLLEKNADMVVATIPYEVKIPYGVIETEGDLIKSLREKPTYTYYSNAGIYMIKKEHLKKIPTSGRYSAPDFMELLYSSGYRVTHFPIFDYWLDVGKHGDYEKAQQDINHLKL